MPFNTRLLYRLDEGQWNLTAQLPSEIGASETLSLSAADSPILTAKNDTGDVQIFKWNDATRQWDSLGAVKVDAAITQFKMLDGADQPMLWLSDDNGSGEIRMRSGAGDTKWSRRIPVALPDNAPKAAASDAVIAGGNIRVVLFTKDGKLLEYSYAMDGRGQAQQATLPTTTVAAEPRAFEWISAIAAGLLMLVLLSTMRRRGQGVPLEAIEAAGIKLAPFGLRLLAGMIDALPVIGTIGIFAARARMTDLQQMDEVMQSSISTMYIVAVAIYILHTMVSEALWGWTIGKKLCGLRVANLDGSKPGFGAIFLRNILRIVDVAMLLPPLLVFVSPLRQRAGDIAAETIVIVAEEHPEPPKS